VSTAKYDRRILAGLALAVLLLGASALLSYRATRHWVDSQERLAHRRTVIALQADLVSELVQLENLLLAMIISPDPSVPAAFADTTNRLGRILVDLRREQARDATHLAVLDRLVPLIQRRTALLSRQIQGNPGLTPEERLAARQEVRTIMASVRHELFTLRADELQHLRQSERLARVDASQLRWLDALFLTLSLVLLAIIFILLLRENASRRDSEARLREARDALELRVQERTAALAGANRKMQEHIAQLEHAREALSQSETKLSRAASALADKNKELEMLVYAASHDLRSPLVNLHGFSRELATACEAIQQQTQAMPASIPAKKALQDLLAGDVAEALQYIRASVEKIDVLIAGLLRYSRLGRETLHIQSVEMTPLLQGIAETMEFQLSAAAASLKIEPLPPCLGDPAQLTQVFSNLLDNALKYRHPDRPPVIVVSGRLSDGQAVFSVADNGSGIAPEDQHRIFEMFHRLNPAAAPGEGLGLSIARRILERQNGEIRVQSAPGVGSTFEVILPAA
jgi:signal transduction histidine kinase